MQKAGESGSEKEEFRMKGTGDDDIECCGSKNFGTTPLW